ncbi:MAG TPA: type II toxin-antitoxin system HicA family toxin [Terriglobia bacterium]|nr:type II toxin-antitoxin system HicA family toxin [Terriglobia bacterium]
MPFNCAEAAGINHLAAVRAFEKAGFSILRQGKHVVMTDGVRRITIPRHNPVNAITVAGIVRDAGLTIDEFRKLL